MHLKRLVIHGLLVTGLLTGFGRITMAHDDGNPPSREQIASAKRTSDLLLATLLAALTQEFDETENPEDPMVDNVGEGKRSISLVFNNRNKDMRLVGTFDPLQATNRPSDAFERTAHGLALAGQAHTAVQRVDDQWYYRRSIPLSNFRAACALCHTNFQPGPTPDWVGALMLRVPIE
jgi:hypothetical protein